MSSALVDDAEPQAVVLGVDHHVEPAAELAAGRVADCLVASSLTMSSAASATGQPARKVVMNRRSPDRNSKRSGRPGKSVASQGMPQSPTWTAAATWDDASIRLLSTTRNDD
ncbi:hypothetical protein ACOZ38_36355 [Sphaerisporangium viridialbum]|uniref:hypothetical protein n=1 Tax=Sphaerisporangium viridialbum TaxID=46189 RepID=UPI003C71CA8A